VNEIGQTMGEVCAVESSVPTGNNQGDVLKRSTRKTEGKKKKGGMKDMHGQFLKRGGMALCGEGGDRGQARTDELPAIEGWDQAGRGKEVEAMTRKGKYEKGMEKKRIGH